MGELLDKYHLLQQGTLWSSNGRCKGYAVSNPGEAAKITDYVTALDGGLNPNPPQLATDTGIGIVGMLTALAKPTPTPAPSPQLIWSGDFDTGDFIQYDSVQQYVAGRASAVTTASTLGGPSAPRAGKYFAQFHVIDGEIVAVGGERCEAVKGGLNIAVGVEQYYAWSIAMPKNFPANGILGQFHSNYNYGQSNIQFFIDHGQIGAFGASSSSPRLCVGVNGGPIILNPDGSPKVMGQYVNQTYSKAFDLGLLSSWLGIGWIDIVIHVIWKDDLTGTVELWTKKSTDSDLVKQVNQVGNIATLYKDHSAYLKVGLYHTDAASIVPDGYIWYDQVRLGDSLDGL